MIRAAWADDTRINAALCAWCAALIWPGEGQSFEDTARAMGVWDGNKVIAVAVFHDWSPKAGVIEISAAAIDRRWLTRPILRAMFGYIFETCGCQMAVMRTTAHERGAHMKRIFTAYGFEHVRIPRLYGRHEDGLVFTLTDDAWRANKFNRAISSEA